MNWFQKLWYNICINDDDQFLKVIADKDLEIKNLTGSLGTEKQLLLDKQNELFTRYQEITDLKAQVPKIDPLETYWNDKRPKNNSYRYKARTILDGTSNVECDPRIFYTPVDNLIAELSTGTNDEKALNALQLVHNFVTYTTDMSQFKYDEEWLLAYETWTLRKGDCEDGAILIANILLKSGVPYWRVRLNAGSVNGGGHCWCTYLRESDNKWIILDWCYWYNSQGTVYSSAENYYNIWFSFNSRYIYLDETFER